MRNADMLAYIARYGQWTVSHGDASVLVVSRDGINFEAGPTIDNSWLEAAVERGYLAWDTPVKTPNDGSRAFTGSGSIGHTDRHHRDIRLTLEGWEMLHARATDVRP